MPALPLLPQPFYDMTQRRGHHHQRRDVVQAAARDRGAIGHELEHEPLHEMVSLGSLGPYVGYGGLKVGVGPLGARCGFLGRRSRRHRVVLSISLSPTNQGSERASTGSDDGFRDRAMVRSHRGRL